MARFSTRDSRERFALRPPALPFRLEVAKTTTYRDLVDELVPREEYGYP